MGEESEAILKGKKITALWLQSSHTLEGPTLEMHAGENIVQEMARSLMKVSRGEKSPGFISPPGTLNGYYMVRIVSSGYPFLSTDRRKTQTQQCATYVPAVSEVKWVLSQRE